MTTYWNLLKPPNMQRTAQKVLTSSRKVGWCVARGCRQGAPIVVKTDGLAAGKVGRCRLTL